MLRAGAFSEKELLKEILLKKLYWVDLRDSNTFKTSTRIRNSTNISWSSLQQKLFMLPNRNVEFGVIAASNEIAEQSMVLLHSKGWVNSGPAIADSELLWSLVSELDIQDADEIGSDYCGTFLFEPSPFLLKHIDMIESTLLEECAVLRCCDIGSGSGRNAGYLSTRGFPRRHRFPLASSSSSGAGVDESSWHWSVDCVDSFPAMLRNVSLMSLDLDCTARIGLHSARITGEGKVREVSLKSCELPCADQLVSPPRFTEGGYNLILCIRFIERSYLDVIVSELLSSGGYLMLSSFVSGDVRVGNANRVLESGELSARFVGLVDVLEECYTLNEDGRVLYNYLCRKRYPRS
jgi:hypothetical protein